MSADGLVVRAAAEPPAHVPGTRLLVLAGDPHRAAAWRAAWPAGDVLVAGELVDATAMALRGPFLGLMAQLGERHASLAWWCSRVSERNTMLSPLFEHCVHVHAALRFDGPVCVVTDSVPVLHVLGEPVEREGLGWMLAAARRVAGFLAGVAARRAAMRDAPLPAAGGDRPRAVVRTVVDDACFTGPDGFSDRYFPGLAAWLEAQGYETWTLPVVMNVARAHREVWSLLGAARGRFLPDLRLLRARDVAGAVLDAVRAVRLPAGPVALEGVDVTALFDAERHRAACDPGTLEAALSARLAGRLAGRGIDVALLVDAYENMIAEKGLLWGVRRDLPATFAAGFQHGALYPLLLCNFVAPGEVPFAPLPDRVVCNGPGFADILVREGLPADRVVAGPALRYRHLREAPAARGDTVLVTLPMPDDAAAELLDKVVAGLAGLPVALKAHPMARADGRLAATGFELIAGPMAPALARARVLVASGSTTLVEAVAAGVPVVVVGRDAALDLNPLAWYPGLARVVRTPEALRAEVQRLLDQPADELDAWRERAAAILDESFAAVTEASLGAFLPG